MPVYTLEEWKNRSSGKTVVVGKGDCIHTLGKVLGECQLQKLQHYLNATT